MPSFLIKALTVKADFSNIKAFVLEHQLKIIIILQSAGVLYLLATNKYRSHKAVNYFILSLEKNYNINILSFLQQILLLQCSAQTRKNGVTWQNPSLLSIHTVKSQ